MKSPANPLTFQRIKTFLHTYKMTEPGCSTKETVVFLHGFGGSSATYHPFLTELADHYDVYAIDLLGMGCSGKPDINYQKLSAEQVIELYVESIKQTVEGLELPRFDLIAHSLGGYLSFHYLRKHPRTVRRFIAVSPGGMVREPTDFQSRLKAKKLPCKSKLMKSFWQFSSAGYCRGRTVMKLLPTRLLIGFWILDKTTLTGAAKKALLDFVNEMFNHPNFAGDMVNRVFAFRAYSRLPVTDFLQGLEDQVDVTHIYGSKDWMDKFSFNKFVQDSSLS